MAASPSARTGSGPEITIAGAGVRCAGAWTVDRIGPLERRLPGLAWPEGERVAIDASGVTTMDTAGAWLLQRSLQALEREGRAVTLAGLRPEHEALLSMVRAAGLAAGPAETPPGLGPLSRLGRRAWASGEQALGILAFLGESGIAALRSAAHPSRIRWRSVLRNVQTAGFDALPIAGLLSFLLGIVIAYQGAAQLARYGANIFVADLVGLAMLRELSPLLTAIIVAGRSGSAYAAEIGTMKVTEEIDALRTVGIPPMDLLVLPKIAALVVALPLLSVYADALGVLGGMIMARSELGVGYADFLDRFQHALGLSDYLVGIGKAPVFAGIIAVVGCYQGFQVTGDAESVGRSTTVSVVQSIFLVIVADALFSVAFSWLGI
jgi:phospholipid/cholesterol/gamma-HCH transport system permease protein